jgi:hypothetical protein
MTDLDGVQPLVSSIETSKKRQPKKCCEVEKRPPAPHFLSAMITPVPFGLGRLSPLGTGI